MDIVDGWISLHKILNNIGLNKKILQLCSSSTHLWRKGCGRLLAIMNPSAFYMKKLHSDKRNNAGKIENPNNAGWYIFHRCRKKINPLCAVQFSSRPHDHGRRLYLSSRSPEALRRGGGVCVCTRPGSA